MLFWWIIGTKKYVLKGGVVLTPPFGMSYLKFDEI